MTNFSQTKIMVILVAINMTNASSGDSVAPPSKRVFASSDGKWWIVLTPIKSEKSSSGYSGQFELYRSAVSGVRKAEEFEMDFVPAVILVGTDGQLAFVDDYFRSGYGDVVRIVSGGKIVKRLTLEEILSPAEIDKQVRHTASNLRWRSVAELRLTRETLQISFDWGKKVSIELAPN